MRLLNQRDPVQATHNDAHSSQGGRIRPLALVGIPLILAAALFSVDANAGSEARFTIIDSKEVFDSLASKAMEDAYDNASRLDKSECPTFDTSSGCLPKLGNITSTDRDSWNPIYRDRDGHRAPIYKSGLQTTKTELLIRDQALVSEKTILTGAKVEFLEAGTEITEDGIPVQITLPNFHYEIDFNLQVTVVEETKVGGADACDGYIGFENYLYDTARSLALYKNPCNKYVYPSGHVWPYEHTDELPVTLHDIDWYAWMEFDVTGFEVEGLVLKGWVKPIVVDGEAEVEVTFDSGIEVQSLVGIKSYDAETHFENNPDDWYVPQFDAGLSISCNSDYKTNCHSFNVAIAEMVDIDLDQKILDELNSALAGSDLVDELAELVGTVARAPVAWSTHSSDGAINLDASVMMDDVSLCVPGDLASFRSCLYDVESQLTIEGVVDSDADSCASGLQAPLAFRSGMSEPTYDQTQDMQFALSHRIFAEAGYEAGRLGQFCETVTTPFDHPVTGAAINLNLNIRPNGRISATKGSYLPTRALTEHEVMMQLAASEALSGDGDAREILETSISMSYSASVLRGTAATPVDAVRVQIPVSITGSRTLSPGSTLSVNTQANLDVYMEPNVSCDNELTLEVKSLQVQNLTGTIEFNPMMGSSTVINLASPAASVIRDEILGYIDEEIYNQYAPSYYVVRKNETACMLGLENPDIGGYYYELYTVPNPKAVISLGTDVTSVELLGMSIVLGGIALDDDHLLADAAFSRTCVVPRVTYGRGECEESNMLSPETLSFGFDLAADYVEGAKALTAYEQTLVESSTSHAAIISQLYGYNSAQAFQQSILDGQMVGPISPSMLQDKYGSDILIDLAAGSATADRLMLPLFNSMVD
jgi:hypothetical protein